MADVTDFKIGRSRILLLAQLVAEFMGTFFLVFVGTGAIMASAAMHGALSNLEIVLAFGGAIGVGVYAVGHISGAHFNPSVTIGQWTVGVFPGRKVVPYILVQLAGATVASLILRSMLGDVAGMGVTLPQHGLVWGALVVEFIGTFLLNFVIYGAAVDPRAARGIQGIAIGGAIVLAGLFAGPISGGSVNPARSFGPALVAGNFSDYWIYVVGPILGGIAANLVYHHLIRRPSEAA